MWRDPTAARLEYSLLSRRMPDHVWAFQLPLNLHLVASYLSPCNYLERKIEGIKRWFAVMLREIRPQLKELFFQLEAFALDLPLAAGHAWRRLFRSRVEIALVLFPLWWMDTPARYLDRAGGIICGQRTLTQGICRNMKCCTFPWTNSLTAPPSLFYSLLCSTIGVIPVLWSQKFIPFGNRRL